MGFGSGQVMELEEGSEQAKSHVGVSNELYSAVMSEVYHME